LALPPDNVSANVARLQLAEALRGVGRLAEDRAELQTALAQSPDFMPARLELGELFLETGALGAALPHLQRAHASWTSPRATIAPHSRWLGRTAPRAHG
jgi:predicted negative regulator of RcsB-dependent stress response